MRVPPDVWPVFVSLAHVALAATVTADAVLRKRHVQAIIGWVGLAWLAPFVGAIAYLCFGINRIRRAATAMGLESAWASRWPTPPQRAAVVPAQCGAWTPALAALERVGRRVTGRPLLAGNRITPMDSGDVAFPRMLAAIDAAQRSISLQTYIFDCDEVGALFREALLRAERRSVAVRVLIDDVGSRYTRPVMARQLRRLGVPARHLPADAPASAVSLRKSAQPSQDHGRGWEHRVHWGHESACRPLAEPSAETPGALSAFPDPGTGGSGSAADVRHRLGLHHR